MVKVRLSLIGLILLLPSWPSQLLFEQSAASVLDRTVLTNDSKFTHDALKSVAADFVEHTSGRYRFAVLNLVTEESRRALELPTSPESLPFEKLVALSKAAARKKFNAARVIVLDGRVALQAHYKSGAIDHTLLGSYSDPVALDVDSLRLRLVEVRLFRSPSLLWRYSRAEGAELKLWFQAPRLPTKEEARMLWQQLKDLTGLSNLVVSIRRVAWWEDGSLPLIFPFENPGDIVYADWRQQPWVAIDSLARGVEYTLFDGSTNKSEQIIPALSSSKK